MYDLQQANFGSIKIVLGEIADSGRFVSGFAPSHNGAYRPAP